ncbi:hypothetical protein BBP40_010728 [Aspergillus hancockii]|nr:hypothetical protein BBP40_010728 [Aspergillus hancockii]
MGNSESRIGAPEIRKCITSIEDELLVGEYDCGVTPESVIMCLRTMLMAVEHEGGNVVVPKAVQRIRSELWDGCREVKEDIGVRLNGVRGCGNSYPPEARTDSFRGQEDKNGEESRVQAQGNIRQAYGQR